MDLLNDLAYERDYALAEWSHTQVQVQAVANIPASNFVQEVLLLFVLQTILMVYRVFRPLIY